MKKGWCPKCQKGILAVTVEGGIWIIHCINCDFKIPYEDRRKEIKQIDFPDRRKV